MAALLSCSPVRGYAARHALLAGRRPASAAGPARARRAARARHRHRRPGRAPAAADAARLYVCGITPYDATHLGHAATYLAFDTLVRVWRDQGHEVLYVQNVTDIDDPLLERAARDGVAGRTSPSARPSCSASDMTALRVLPPTWYVGAVEAMDEIADLVVPAAGAGRHLHRRRRRLLLGRPRRSGSAPSATSTSRPCCSCPPSAVETPTGRQEGPARLPALDAAAARRARLAVAVRRRPARLARRVHSHGAQPARRTASTCRAAAPTWSSRTTSCPPPRPRWRPARRRSPGPTCTPAWSGSTARR